MVSPSFQKFQIYPRLRKRKNISEIDYRSGKLKWKLHILKMNGNKAIRILLFKWENGNLEYKFYYETGELKELQLNKNLR